ncbi:MAG TPA: inositol monophosphatase family protein [Chromatiales bacterium]|nr:inositol monophosphatase family protein [Chromatiales bacterium]
MDFLRALVEEIAKRELMGRFCRIEGQIKADGSVVTETDLVMQHQIEEGLRQRWPEIPLLGEEMRATEQKQLVREAEGYWCLDPLDGTTNYAAGLPFFAVSLAYIHTGVVQAGIVYDPVRCECFSALRGEGAWLNDAPLRLAGAVPPLVRCIGVVDLKRLDRRLRHALVDDPPFRSLRSLGAVALEWCWLAAGRCQLYLHGGQKLWDYAAGSLILEEAGGHGCLLDGMQGECGGTRGLTPQMAIAAVDGTLFNQWRRWLQAQ